MTRSRSTATLTGAVSILGVSVAALATFLLLTAVPTIAAEPQQIGRLDAATTGWAFVAAALSTALAALGAGYAVARVGSAAIGAIAEKPELFGRVLVLVGLAEGIAIYGLIVSILILNRVA